MAKISYPSVNKTISVTAVLWTLNLVSWRFRHSTNQLLYHDEQPIYLEIRAESFHCNSEIVTIFENFYKKTLYSTFICWLFKFSWIFFLSEPKMTNEYIDWIENQLPMDTSSVTSMQTYNLCNQLNAILLTSSHV